MPKYHIGTLSSAAQEALAIRTTAPDTSSPNNGVFLDPRSWRCASLVSKRVVSWDTRIFTFSLNHATQALGLPVGQHLMIKLRDAKGEAIVRPYTPLSDGASVGTVDVLVKVYFEEPDRGSKGGKMTLALDALCKHPSIHPSKFCLHFTNAAKNSIALGQQVDFKGPIGKFTYLGGGRFSLEGNTRNVKSMTMICAGSGITPIYAVLRAIMQDATDPTRCTVIDSNRLEEDILCRQELDALHEANTARMTLVHTLTAAGESWTGRRGRINKGLIQEVGAGAELWLVCGPEGMEDAVRKIFAEMGVLKSDVVFF